MDAMFDNVLPEESSTLLRDLNGWLVSYGFHLAGGTGLALQLGHRVSEDLDFFTTTEFEPASVAALLQQRPGYEETAVARGTLHCRLGKVKLSFLHYPVPLRQPTHEHLAVVVADWSDVLAEKFKTLSQRGARRDFYDIYACIALKQLSVPGAVAVFKDRFAGTGVNYQHIAKSLVWFEDADAQPDPRLLMPANWPQVRRFFQSRAAEFAQALS